MHDKDIHFVFDEEWDEQEKELRQILHETNSPQLHKNVFVLESLMRAAAMGFVGKKIIKKNPDEMLGEEVTKSKYYQKILNIPTGVEVLPVPVPSTENIMQPEYEFKEVPQYTQKIILEPESKEKIDFSKSRRDKVNLIVDRITKRVLASVNIDKDYLLEEPKLDEIDLVVLEKVKDKKIKNMEQGWKLIQKYAKKYGINPGHDTLIKYYIVNDVFGLGKIEPLLHDKDLESIKCDGPMKNLIVEVNGKNYKSNLLFHDEDLRNFIVVMANKLGKKLNKKNWSISGELRGVIFKLSMGENLNMPSFLIKRI